METENPLEEVVEPDNDLKNMLVFKWSNIPGNKSYNKCTES